MSDRQRLRCPEDSEGNTAVRQTRAGTNPTLSASAGPVQVLVISQHDLVRCQLVAYLRRSAPLVVSGDELSAETIVRAHPDVVVLDLSRLGPDGLHQALDATRHVDARL